MSSLGLNGAEPILATEGPAPSLRAIHGDRTPRMPPEKGTTLIEVVISILVLGIVVLALTTFFQWSLGVFGYVDRKATAESVARSQWEYVKGQEYKSDFSYDVIDAGNYSVNMTASESVAEGMQRIEYTVTSPPQADGEPITVKLQGYKVDR